MIKRVALFVAVALGLPLIATAPAFAQHRSPLADAPAIRKRVEFRASRLEIGVGAGSTVNQTFNHAVLMNVRLGFHITDWLAISGFGGFNVAQLKTSFNSRLQDTLPDNMADGRAPTQSDAAASINKILRSTQVRSSSHHSRESTRSLASCSPTMTSTASRVPRT